MEDFVAEGLEEVKVMVVTTLQTTFEDHNINQVDGEVLTCVDS